MLIYFVLAISLVGYSQAILTRCYDCFFDDKIDVPFEPCRMTDPDEFYKLAAPVCPDGRCFIRRNVRPDGTTMIRRGCMNDYPLVDDTESCVVPPVDEEARTWIFCQGDLCNSNPYVGVKDPVEIECEL